MNRTQMKMWKVGLVSVALAFAFGASGAKAADDVIKLSFATYWPGTASVADDTIAFMKEVEIRTNGRVVFDPINYKGLFGAKELQGAAADGAVDVVWASPMYTPSDNPLRTLLAGGPFLGKTVASQAQCINYLYETWEPMQDDFHKNGVKLLYMRAGPNMKMITEDMISGPEDLVGAKIRAHGKVFSAGMANLGAIPVLVEAFDIEQQMRAGNLQASSETGGTGAGRLARNIGGTTTLIDPGIGAYGAAHMLMGMKTWDSLPADIQQLFTDMRWEWANVVIQSGASDEAQLLKDIEESGQPYLAFSREQRAKLLEMMDVEGEIKKLLAEVDAAGYPGTEAVKRYRECADIVDRINPIPSNGASDVNMAKVIGLHKGEPYEN